MSSSSSDDAEEFPGRLLHQAALWDNAELLEDLLHGEQISHLNCQDAWGRTPLHAAATTESSHCIRILLQAGADPNIKSGSRADGRTCLHVAAEHGAVENVKLLLAHGADLLAQDANGLTALDIAEQAEHEACMECLKHAADVKELARQELHSTLREACGKGDVQKARSILRNLGVDAETIINSSPNGTNTLLFRACEEGQKDMVRLLLEHNADGRIHPVTKYSPLYIACYYGRRDIAELLLKKFPKLVSVCTVEKWLPLHACIINGHTSILELLLRHTYPTDMLHKFRDKTGTWEYEMAFDINAKDVTGQSGLYLACYVGNQKLVELLLKYKVHTRRVKTAEDENRNQDNQGSQPSSVDCTEEKSEGSSPSRHRIAGSIHSLMTKLNLVRGESADGDSLMPPVLVDMYCNNNTETALHVAVKNKHHNIVAMLLAAGANPNMRMYLPDDETHKQEEDEYIFTGSTALVEACRNRDMGMLDLLLRNHARDDECKALFIAAQNKEELIVSKLLALKAHHDPEFKVNKRAFDIKPSQQFSSFANAPSVGVYSSLYPSNPVMINWHGQHCLSYIKDQWLVDASVNVNPKLKLSPRNQSIALYAITRLDISNNSLSHLPEMIFQLPSLRMFNASQNKLEHLPPNIGQLLVDGTVTLPRKGRRYEAPDPVSVIEEIHLKDNRLVSLPEGLFMLPNLQHLDVSNNKLVSLPFKMWSAPKLRELSASLNLLQILPTKPDGISQDAGSNLDTSSEVSDEDSIASASDVTLEDLMEESPSLRKPQDIRGVLSLDKHGNIVTCCRTRELTHHNMWSSSIQIQESLMGTKDGETGSVSMLQSLNLSHNNFATIPQALPCLAVNLSRLNLGYNRLMDMGHATCYPAGLKHLDLSHNNIQSWPSVHRSESLESIDHIPVSSSSCYSLNEALLKSPPQKTTPNRRTGISGSGNRSRGSTSSFGSLSGMCIHRRHQRLESLRTLVLADNKLARLSLHMDDLDGAPINEGEEIENKVRPGTPVKHRLLFPSLSMLDVSNNKLRELPANIHELTNLSVLNIAGNSEIIELPSEMGLLSRLWNLNTRGCSLQEPLKSMIDSKKYKTMDVIGYLKSILEDARPYARMKLMIVGVQGIGKTSLLEQLRQEGSGSYRKKPVEHWAKRMGNKNINTRTSKGTILSTVGVDIGDWIYEKKVRGHSTYGPVTFRTWDFGGQKEYYATHQYFLSKRSLYLIVWNICDGDKGVEEILQWLVNIQSRAPNSPVLIVGTHYDLGKEKFPPSWSEDLQQMIRNRFINVIDADKLGLPRVLDTIEVSCKTRHNIKLLCNLIYDTVFSLKTPGSKERLLEQKIPASYLALEDVIVSLAMDRRSNGRDPVLPAERFHSLVTREMAAKGHKPFRDTAELNQAATFLHENGVLLHYEDVTLKDLYFLDPQWLCDMLAHVVTIREINPFVRNGLMKLDDLKHVFKSSACAPFDAKSYIVSLLNKFEVALTWDNRTLLIPSLLPNEDSIARGAPGHATRVPLRSRGWSVRGKKFCNSPASSGAAANVDLFTSVTKSSEGENASVENSASLQITHRATPNSTIRRLLMMSYFPSGFWSRLLTRVLADDTVVDIVKNYFVVPQEVVSNTDQTRLLGGQAEWICWQTGMELHYAHTTLFRLREVTPCGTTLDHQTSSRCTGQQGGQTQCTHSNPSYDYRAMKFLIKLEGSWSPIEVKNSALMEVFLPNEAVVLRRTSFEDEESAGQGKCFFPRGIQSVVLDPSPECVAKLLALAVDHIDTLLEDWYPTLGTRFVHTSEGKFLVTRLVPCPSCLECHGQHEAVGNHPHAPSFPENWGSFVEMNPLYCSMTGSVMSQALRGHCVRAPPPANLALDPQRPNIATEAAAEASATLPETEKSPVSPLIRRLSWGSRGSNTSDGDSGVGPDSASSSRNPSAEGRPDLQERKDDDDATQEITPVIYSFMTEECILAAHSARAVGCPLHGQLLLAQIAPDTVFMDLGDRYLVRPETIKQGKLLGRGGFGFVFEGSCRHRSSGEVPLSVALKMMQPVNPGLNARPSAIAAFKASQSKWERDPVQYACKAYCSARQEVNILLSLHHPNVVPLVGVCPRPLALVLELAPLGSLDQCLKHYLRSGARLSLLTLQLVILQVAKAIEYLHGQHIIYRDLKSENVLVWDLPAPFQNDSQLRVDVRLADYGISRSALPIGSKGFGGTEGFMAPEMMRHNGEEEYTEKVDCFSFGMFMYELLTTHQPYEYCDNVKEHVLEGGRPTLTHRETESSVYMLDLMVMCWSQHPRYRPSASQMVSIASAPEFTHLLDVVSLDQSFSISCAIRVTSPKKEDSIDLMEQDDCEFRAENGQVWLGRSANQLDILSAGLWGWTGLTTIEGLPEAVTAICQVKDLVWLGDSAGSIHGYRVDTYNWVFSYCLESESSSASVRTICCLNDLGRVAVALSSGRLFLCRSDTTPTSPVMGEGSFILTELAGFTKEIYAIAKVPNNNDWTLWCGGSNGIISVFTLRKDGHVTAQEEVSHLSGLSHPPVMQNENVADVTLLYSLHELSSVKSNLRNSLWSYVHPGCIVYHWDATSKELVNRLDCSKLVPCSESLKSISIEEHLSHTHCQVTAMAVCGDELFVGTVWGCVVVAEAASMRPITVFRPFEADVRAIVPLPSQVVESGSEDSDHVSKEDNPPLVASIGKGYRNLLSRYATVHKSKESEGDLTNSLYCLIWRSHQWFNS